MKRRVFNLAAGVSLLLCFATVGLWARSYRHGDFVCVIGWRTLCDFASTSGQLHVEVSGTAASSGMDFNTREPQYILSQDAPPRSLNFLGFDFVHGPVPNYGYFHFYIVGMPHWFVALLLLLLPLKWTLRRRLISGACANCGYDLRATPERCPECGLRQAQTAAG